MTDSLLLFCLFLFCLPFSVFSGPLCQRLASKNNNTLVKVSKLPSWSQSQLKEAISCVLTQQMRFTQASARFKIPKGTLYDNILGKTKRSRMLEEIGLSPRQEMAVLEFACDVAMMPYNRQVPHVHLQLARVDPNCKENGSYLKKM